MSQWVILWLFQLISWYILNLFLQWLEPLTINRLVVAALNQWLQLIWHILFRINSPYASNEMFLERLHTLTSHDKQAWKWQKLCIALCMHYFSTFVQIWDTNLSPIKQIQEAVALLVHSFTCETHVERGVLLLPRSNLIGYLLWWNNVGGDNGWVVTIVPVAVVVICHSVTTNIKFNIYFCTTIKQLIIGGDSSWLIWLGPKNRQIKYPLIHIAYQGSLRTRPLMWHSLKEKCFNLI